MPASGTEAMVVNAAALTRDRGELLRATAAALADAHGFALICLLGPGEEEELAVAGDRAVVAPLDHDGRHLGALLAALPVGLERDAGEAIVRAAARAVAARLSTFAASDRDPYRQLLAHSTSGIVRCRMIFDGDRPVDWLHLEANAAFRTHTGLPDPVGRLVSELIPGIRDTDPELFEVLARIARGGPPERFERPVAALQQWFKVSAYSPRPGEFVAIFDLVTERRRAAAELLLQASALEAAANAIVITDTSGAMQWVNGAFTRLTGYSAAEVMGANPRILGSGRQPASFYREMWQTILDGQVWRGELVNRKKDGSLYDEEMTTTPVHDVGGTVTHFIAIKQDVTERNLAAARHREVEDQLRASQKMEAIGRLASGVAHDFNNVLNVIYAYSEFAREGLADGDPRRADLDEIIAAAERAAALTRQLLSFSRRELTAPVPIDLAALIDGMAKMLRRLIGEDVELIVRHGADLDPIRADHGQLEQVVLNLVVNARDAMPEGGRITIATANVPLDPARAGALGVPPGPYVELQVTDTGTGMDAATRARIFEPFFTTKCEGRGTGLGLSIIYGIVRHCGGAVAVDSEPGAGATFHVLLPRDRGVEEVPRRRTRPPTTPHGRETVLVVEDDAPLRAVMTRALAAAGYDVRAATGRDEAIAVVEALEGKIDLVLTDVILPGRSGREVAADVQARAPSAKVIFISGYADDAIERYDVRGPRFLAKPFAPEALVHKVRAVLDEA